MGAGVGGWVGEGDYLPLTAAVAKGMGKQAARQPGSQAASYTARLT